MQNYSEKMMERLSSGESKTIFWNIFFIIGLTTSGRKAWQEEEETRKGTSIVLVRQEQCTKITIILEQGEWPIAKDAEPFSRRFNAKHWQTFYDLESVNIFDIGSICLQGEELLRQFTFHQKYRRKSVIEANVRDIWTVDIGTISWDFFSVSNQLGKFSMETVISGLWWRSHQSLELKGLRIFDSVLCFGKVNQNPTSKVLLGNDSWIGSKIHHNTELWTKLMVSQWNRVEYLLRIRYIAALQQSPRVTVKIEHRVRRFHRTNDLHVDVQRHLMENSRQWTGMRIEPQPRLYLCETIFTRKMVIPRSDLDQKRSGILLMKANHKENGTESQNEWW